MRAHHAGAGITILLNDADRKLLLKDNRLKCKASTHAKALVKLVVLEEVISGDFEEPGFHIEASPSGEPKDKTYYRIEINPRIRDYLLQDHDHRGNCFISRSRYDRISINYFGNNLL